MAVSETWLTSNTPTECIDIAGYDFIRRDKPEDFIGAQGVGLYVKHGISYTHRIDLEHKHLMNTGVQVNLPNRRPINVVAYFKHTKFGEIRQNRFGERRRNVKIKMAAVQPTGSCQ